ncbi:MAG: isoprenylcysteine carboxylmethyltransferase family protein [Acidobacteriota bacterium]|jgi:protein-S-isoprenylcysteine O-methyltransferase Ste14|nr:isoprenylcysteine carboxylmethyltransferase family protein [Acidobacteriota bacterium]
MPNEKDNPGVIAPPPLIFLSGLLVGGLISGFFPVEILPRTLAVIAGISLAVAGLTIILTAIVQMRRAKTNVEPWKPTTAILDEGLYAVSRNPIYLAMALIYLGIAFLFNSFWFLPPLVLVLPAIHFGVILREEKYLERKFGDEYLNYKTSVRRWI